MKTMKQFLLIIFLFLSAVGTAQNSTFLPDEIWYDSGKNIIIQFCLPSVSEVSKYADDTITFTNLYAMNLPDKIQKSGSDKKIRIEIDELKNESSIRSSGDFSLINIFPSEFHQGDASNFQELKLITKDGAKINCYFSNPDELISFLRNDWKNSIKSINKLIDTDVAGFKHKPVILLYQNKDEQIQNIAKNINTKVNYLDMLVLKGGVSVGLFKGNFLPGIDAELGLMFSQKGIMKNYYFVNAEEMFGFVTENNQLVPKSGLFIDLGYKRNFSKNPDKADWYGFSVGYLVRENSAIFDDNTWRLSVHRDISKNIELVPQLYFPDNFSKIFPGLKITVSF